MPRETVGGGSKRRGTVGRGGGAAGDRGEEGGGDGTGKEGGGEASRGGGSLQGSQYPPCRAGPADLEEFLFSLSPPHQELWLHTCFHLKPQARPHAPRMLCILPARHPLFAHPVAELPRATQRPGTGYNPGPLCPCPSAARAQAPLGGAKDGGRTWELVQPLDRPLVPMGEGGDSCGWGEAGWGQDPGSQAAGLNLSPTPRPFLYA